MKIEACADDGLRRPCPVNARLAPDTVHPVGLFNSYARRNDTVADLPLGRSIAIYSVRVIQREDALHFTGLQLHVDRSRAHRPVPVLDEALGTSVR